jgi:hypothetical protein
MGRKYEHAQSYILRTKVAEAEGYLGQGLGERVRTLLLCTERDSQEEEPGDECDYNQDRPYRHCKSLQPPLSWDPCWDIAAVSTIRTRFQAVQVVKVAKFKMKEEDNHQLFNDAGYMLRT